MAWRAPLQRRKVIYADRARAPSLFKPQKLTTSCDQTQSVVGMLCFLKSESFLMFYQALVFNTLTEYLCDQENTF